MPERIYRIDVVASDYSSGTTKANLQMIRERPVDGDPQTLAHAIELIVLKRAREASRRHRR